MQKDKIVGTYRRLFELESEEDPSDHEHVHLSDGWQNLVSEAGFCDSCSEVVWIRLRQAFLERLR
jgi:hypothetical protein